MPARIKILVPGKLPSKKDKSDPAYSTITLITDGNKKIIVDPGIVPSKQIILDVLKKENLTPDDITHVFLTHTHLDHFRYLGLFENITTIDYWGVWDNKNLVEINWKAPFKFSDNIQVLHTPGHDDDCITFLVNGTTTLNNNEIKGKIAICGDVFWDKNFPKIDTYAKNQILLNKSRQTVIKESDYIIPGHSTTYKSKN